MRLIPSIRSGTEHYPEKVARRLRGLNIANRIAAATHAFYAVVFFLDFTRFWWLAIGNTIAMLLYAGIPLLHRLGHLAGPIAGMVLYYADLLAFIYLLGTGIGIQFYYLLGVALTVLYIGPEYVALATASSAVAAALIIAAHLTLPYNTGLLPEWLFIASLVANAAVSCGTLLLIVSYALREAARAEAAAEREYDRSERLLANILPATIAGRLKDRTETVIADRFDHASILFADMAGFTARASDTDPVDLVRFLNRAFSDFDRLVESHGLEKIKTTGDAYMVVSGVPVARPDHAEALAQLALDMRDGAADLRDPHGRGVPIRIGIASGPVVAGVVGTRKFFYDVWGDAVNVAARMETSGVPGKIHVAPETYELLKSEFVFEDRGLTDIKGKGPMRTWFLVDRRAPVPERLETRLGGRAEAVAPLAVAARTQSPFV